MHVTGKNCIFAIDKHLWKILELESKNINKH